MREYVVNLIWDNEAAVWIATSDDIPGLSLESGSMDALIERVRFAAPEMLESREISPRDIAICFRSERHERACG